MSSVENAHLLANPSTKIFDKEKKEVIIYPRGIDIVWSGDSRYWNIPTDKKPARLRQVCWLEVTTSVKRKEIENFVLDPKQRYKVGFKISFAPDAFGWGTNYPVYFMIKRGNSTKWKKMTLDETNTEIAREVDTLEIMEKDTLKSSEDDDIISFGLYEVWSGKWKGGLEIHYAFVKAI